jgi:hypothetical protein
MASILFEQSVSGPLLRIAMIQIPLAGRRVWNGIAYGLCEAS